MNSLLGVPQNSPCYTATSDNGLQWTLLHDQVFVRFILGTILQPDSTCTDRCRAQQADGTPHIIQVLHAVANVICHMNSPLRASTALENLPVEAWIYIGECMASAGSSEWLCYTALDDEVDESNEPVLGHLIDGNSMAEIAKRYFDAQDDPELHALSQKPNEFFIRNYNWTAADKYMRDAAQDVQTILHPGAAFSFGYADSERNPWLQQLFGRVQMCLGDLIVNQFNSDERVLVLQNVESIASRSPPDSMEDLPNYSSVHSHEMAASRDPFA